MNKEEKERILKRVLSQIETERAPRRTHGLKRAAVIALAAVMVLACGAFTIKVLDLDTRLASLFKGDHDQIAKTVTELHAATEKNGLRIEAKQAVGDGHRVFILLEVTSLTDRKLDSSCNFENLDISYTNEGSYGAEWGVMQEEDGVNDGKHLSFLITLNSQYPSDSQTATITLKNLSRSSENGEKIKRLFTGEWELSFSLNYKDESQTYHLGKQIPFGKETMRVDTITISPLSCMMTANVSKYDPEDPDIDKYLFDLETGMKIKLKDGSLVPVSVDGSGFGGGKNAWATLDGTLANMVDMDQVESILIRGEEIPLKQDRE